MQGVIRAGPPWPTMLHWGRIIRASFPLSILIITGSCTGRSPGGAKKTGRGQKEFSTPAPRPTRPPENVTVSDIYLGYRRINKAHPVSFLAGRPAPRATVPATADGWRSAAGSPRPPPAGAATNTDRNSSTGTGRLACLSSEWSTVSAGCSSLLVFCPCDVSFRRRRCPLPWSPPREGTA